MTREGAWESLGPRSHDVRRWIPSFTSRGCRVDVEPADTNTTSKVRKRNTCIGQHDDEGFDKESNHIGLLPLVCDACIIARVSSRRAVGQKVGAEESAP